MCTKDKTFALSSGERREMLAGVEARLEDLDRVLKETNNHRQSFLTDKVQSLNKWLIQVSTKLVIVKKM